jgi:hypothetical protein
VRNGGDTDTSDGFWPDRTVVEITPLDQEERVATRAPQLVDLAPEPSSENRLVKVGHRLCSTTTVCPIA